ncbi:MAG: diguanylate cyclase, partial [Chloroflexi bacterium]
AHAFSDAEESLVIALATQAAIAIQNARLFEAEQRRREVAHALLEITQVASSSLELTQVLKHIAQRAAAICNASRCAIFLLNPTGERLDPVMAQFADGHVDSDLWATFKTLTAPVDAIPLLQKAIRECRPALFDDPSRTDLVPRAWSEPFGVQKLLAVPLISHDRAIGVMVLDITETGGKFTPDQIDLAVTIGGQVAASIENAQLYSRMQHMAITDSLTGLYNRRGIFELGSHEINRARRFDRPLAAIMFDLDHFKRINDTHGHPIGDQVLAGLAARCRLSLRDVDLLGRYGGEEFAVLLSETSLSDAQRVAERLRRRVAWAPFETDRGPMRVTISLGVAPLDEHCQDLTALLERADQALYAAKQAGRNQVCVWSP